jgi:thiol-disulfide isomerase/thioredoxin
MHTQVKGLTFQTKLVYTLSKGWVGLCLLLTLACKQENTCNLHIEIKQPINDTLFIRDFATKKYIAALPLQSKSATHVLSFSKTFIAQVFTKKERETDVMLFSFNRDKHIRIDATSILSVNNLPDSLLRYNRFSTNQILRDYYYQIADKTNPMRVQQIFDSARIARENQIDNNQSLLHTDELEILKRMNVDNMQSFLFFYGTQLNALPYTHPFFDFINDIEISSEHIFITTNAIRKLEVKFIRERDTLRTIQEFMAYIDKEVEDTTFADFLQVSYLKEIIGSPTSWPLHKTIVNTDAVKEVLEKEKQNPYFNLIKNTAESFYATQKDNVAYNFVAKDLLGNEIQLSHYKGKFVLIDVWATWCATCMDPRKELIEWANKNKEQQEVVILFVSVDQSHEKWRKEVAQTNANGKGIELIVSGEFNGSFAQNYLIQSIPKYILIDREGKIVNANLSNPVQLLEKGIALHQL